MLDPVHHMLDGVHYMMDRRAIIWWTPSKIWWMGSIIWWIPFFVKFAKPLVFSSPRIKEFIFKFCCEFFCLISNFVAELFILVWIWMIWDPSYNGPCTSYDGPPVHHLMDPIQHLMDGVHYMIDKVFSMKSFEGVRGKKNMKFSKVETGGGKSRKYCKIQHGGNIFSIYVFNYFYQKICLNLNLLL